MRTIVRTQAEAPPSAPAVATVLEAVARERACRMILAALAVEEEDRQQHDARDRRSHAWGGRNGETQPRRMRVGGGRSTVRAPRGRDQRVPNGTRQQFTRALLPPSLHRSLQISAVWPRRARHGLSTGDVREALPVRLGADAAGVRPPPSRA